jgi:hypothetical protein
MSRLRSCYFCGAVGDALREYELVPERLVGADGARSAVLCSSCREKLRRVLEPAIEGADAAGSPAADDEGPSPDAAGVGEVTFDAAGPTPEGPTADEPVAGDGRDGEANDEDERGDGDTDDVPDGYYKVLRLLQNREFPMERADLTALVTGAYDVPESRCERIVETAVERGVLVADGPTLDVGRD